MEVVLPVLLGACGLGGAVFVFCKVRETQHLVQIAKGFPRIQLAAIDNEVAGAGRIDFQTILASQCFRTVLGFRLVYTCDRTETGDVVHHLSGQLQAPRRERLISNMLLVLGSLLTQFKAAQLSTEGWFEVEETEFGTQHLEFRLTAAEHEALRRVLVTGNATEETNDES